MEDREANCRATVTLFPPTLSLAYPHILGPFRVSSSPPASRTVQSSLSTPHPPAALNTLFASAKMSSRGPKQSMTELKLRRLLEHNQRLRDDLARPRIRVSEASARFVRSPYGRLIYHGHLVRKGRSLRHVRSLFHQFDSLLQNDN